VGDGARAVPAARVHSRAQWDLVVPGYRLSAAPLDAVAPAEDRGVRSVSVRSSRCFSSQSDVRRNPAAVAPKFTLTLGTGRSNAEPSPSQVPVIPR
jgi:hypothetical protein